MRKLTLLLAGLALLLTTASAMATPLTGSINFTGALTLTGSDSAVTTQNATGIQFANPSYVMLGATGAYSGILVLTQVTFNNFTFDPTLTLSNPLWTLTSGTSTFDFILTSVDATRTAPNGLLLNGTGTLQGTNYDDSFGTWSLTTQDGNGTSGILSFSATSAPVPEPCTMMLLGAGLLGLSIYGKRRKNA